MWYINISSKNKNASKTSGGTNFSPQLSVKREGSGLSGAAFLKTTLGIQPKNINMFPEDKCLSSITSRLSNMIYMFAWLNPYFCSHKKTLISRRIRKRSGISRSQMVTTNPRPLKYEWTDISVCSQSRRFILTFGFCSKNTHHLQ